MKLSNIAIIFVVIALPLLLILSYYISLQIDTINLQTTYNSKLLDSTKEAIEALEINTVEWNDAYQKTYDSKRRDVTASINTFTTSLANNLGVAGTSKDYMISNIPAVAYTLYDGFYIYSPTQTKVVIKDDKGVAVFMKEEVRDDGNVVGYNTTNFYTTDKGKILYEYDSATGGSPAGSYYGIDFTLDVNHAKTEIKHILKPFMAYSEPIYSNKDNEEVVINYTLDNYVTVYCRDEQQPPNYPYVAKSGYLNKISKSGSDENTITIADKNFNNGYSEVFIDAGTKKVVDDLNPIKDIKFSGQTMRPEILTETITYLDSGTIRTGTYNYVYEAEKDVKIYYDDSVKHYIGGSAYGSFFRLDSRLNKIYIEDLTEPLYKKCSIPTLSKVGGVTQTSYKKIYQNLSDFKWYTKDETGAYRVIENGDNSTQWDELLYNHHDFADIRYDYSAINYCVEAYVYTDWFNRQNFEYVNPDGTKSGAKVIINNYNDADTNNSSFSMHKKDVIKNLLRDNLKQAITSYSRNSDEDFKIPELTENEWDQVVSNVSIVTFLQNIPIGLKNYNNYSIATSTQNREFVNKNELYFYNKSSDNPIYHAPYCTEYTDSGDNLIGYRSVDYIYKYYNSDDDDDELKYYFQHTTNTGIPVKESCYKCLVQRSLEEDYEIQPAFKKSYYTTLARERYLQLDSIVIEQSDITVTKSIDNILPEYGDIVTYTVTINNKGSINDRINIRDYYNNSELTNMKFVSAKLTKTDGTVENLGTPIQDTYSDTVSGANMKYQWEGININPKEIITITFTAKITGAIGSTVTNNVAVYSYNVHETVIATAEANAQIKKTIKIEAPTETTEDDYNIVLVLDHSNSMLVGLKSVKLYRGVKAFLENENIRGLFDDADEKSLISVIHFDDKADIEYEPCNDIDRLIKRYDNKATWGGHGAGTHYCDALTKAYYKLEEMHNRHPDNENVVVFFTDGEPTKGWGFASYAMTGENEFVSYNFWALGGAVETGRGNIKEGREIWIDGFSGFKGVKGIISDIKSLGADVYCINCHSSRKRKSFKIWIAKCSSFRSF